MNSNSKNYLVIILLLVTLGTGSFAWYDLRDKVAALQTSVTRQQTTAVTRGGRGATGANTGAVGAGALGLGAIGGGGGGAAGGGGRRGAGGIANLMQTLGLTDDQQTQLTDLSTQRTAALQAARQNATAQGLDQINTPDEYTAMMAAATVAIDNQIGQISPEVLTQLQQTAQRGGRRGAAGAAGAAGVGGRRGGG